MASVYLEDIQVLQIWEWLLSSEMQEWDVWPSFIHVVLNKRVVRKSFGLFDLGGNKDSRKPSVFVCVSDYGKPITPNRKACSGKSIQLVEAEAIFIDYPKFGDLNDSYSSPSATLLHFTFVNNEKHLNIQQKVPCEWDVALHFERQTVSLSSL